MLDFRIQEHPLSLWSNSLTLSRSHRGKKVGQGLLQGELCEAEAGNFWNGWRWVIRISTVAISIAVAATTANRNAARMDF